MPFMCIAVRKIDRLAKKDVSEFLESFYDRYSKVLVPLSCSVSARQTNNLREDRPEKRGRKFSS